MSISIGSEFGVTLRCARLALVVAVAGFVAPACGSDRSCDDVDRDVASLLAAQQSCSSDAECAEVSVDGPCLTPFGCGTVLNASKDLESFRAQVKGLSDEHRQLCNMCAEPLCADTTMWKAVCTGGKCTLVQNQ